MSSSEIRRASPYQGLIPYSEADAPFFFGREKETRLITANLFASPLTLLYGASGVGKSSVLRAGVARQLREREDLLVVVFNSWQGNPVSDLIQTIADQAKLADPAKWSEAMSLLPLDSEASLGEVLAIFAGQLERRLMIILDQFEEYFLYHPLDDEFAADFSKAVTKAQAPVSFLISIREDFYAKLDRFEGRIPALYDNYLRIEHLDRKAARIAIEKPIVEYNQRYGTDGQFTIEPDLVSAVLRQVETGQVIIGEAGRGVIEAAQPHEDSEAQIETPFLQLVMTRLWEQERAEGSQRLRLETLKRLGGAENIVRTHLDAVIARLTNREQDVAASIFHYLVTPSGTKIAYSASDLAGSAELSEPEVFGVLEKLSHGDVRILRPVDPPVDRPTAPRYEIFHDVLAPAILTWRTSYVQAQERADADLRAEQERQRADEQARVANRFRRLAIALAIVILLALGTAVFAIAQTVKAKANAVEAKANALKADNYARESDKLRVEGEKSSYEGAKLKSSGEEARRAAMIANAQAQRDRLRTEEQIKIAQKRKAEAEKAQGVARLQTIAAANANAAANQATIAAKNQASATRVAFSNLLSVQSGTLLNEHPQLSTLLAIEALRATNKDDPPTPAAETALRKTIAQTGGSVFSDQWDEDEGWVVHEVTVSADGHWLVSATTKKVRLFDLNSTNSNSPVRILEGAGKPIAVSPDGRWLFAGGSDARRHQSQDKQREGKVLRWDLSDRRTDSQPIILPGPASQTNQLLVSPDGRWLVASAILEAGATTRVWDLKSPDVAAKILSVDSTPPDPRGPANSPVTVAISPDSRWLVTSAGPVIGGAVATGPGSLRLWNLGSNDPTAAPRDLSGHKFPVSEAIFSPDGHWLATGSWQCDDGVRLWNLKSPEPAQPIVLDHKGSIGAVAFSPDNHWLVTGGGSAENCNSDFTARVWDLTADKIAAKSYSLPQHEGPIFAASFSPDNSFLITVAGRGYSLVNGFSRGDGDVKGTRRLGGLEGGATARAWHWAPVNEGPIEKVDAAPFQNLILRDPENAAHEFAISPDNRWLMATTDNRAVLWDLTYSAAATGIWPSRVLLGHESDLSSIAFRLDSRRLVTAGCDKTARVWDLSTGGFTATPLSLTTLAYQSPIVQGADRRLLVATIDEHAPASRIETSQESYARGGAVALVYDVTASDPARPLFRLQGHKGKIKSAALSANNRWLATGSNDKTVRLWDLTAADPTAHPLVFTGYQGAVDDVTISSDNHWLATASHDGETRLWDLTATDPTAHPLVLNTFKTRVHESYQYTNQVFISSDSRWLVTSGYYYFSAPAALWDLKATDPSAHFTELGLLAGNDVAFSPDSRWLLVFRNQGSVNSARLWDLKREPLSASFVLTSDKNKTMSKAAFSSDGHWLFTLSFENMIRRWDLSANDPSATPFLLTSPLNEPGQALTDIALSPNNRWLVADMGMGRRILWNLSSTDPNAARYVLKNAEGFGNSQVAFAPDSRWLVTSDEGSLSETTKILKTRNLILSGVHNLRWDLMATDPSTAPVAMSGGMLISKASVTADSRWLILKGGNDLELWHLGLDDLIEIGCRTAGRNLSKKDEWQTYFPGQPYRKTCVDLPDHQ